MKRVALDLTKYHWRRRYGDLTAYGTWAQGEDGWQPCLVLAPTDERRLAHTLPAVVPLNQIWIWSEEIGDVEKAAAQALQCVEQLGLEDTVNNIVLVASVIRDCIGDLTAIPPMPAGDSVVVADATISKDGEVVRQVEVSERV